MKKRSSTLSQSSKSSRLTCPKYRFKNDRFKDYKVDRHNNGATVANKLNSRNNCFTEALDYKNYCLAKQC